jgi:ribosomally synthesized peptide (two-chain TOMM family)
MDNFLMDLRLAYLRAIADAWKDTTDTIKNTLIDSNTDLIDYLKKNYGLHSPWESITLQLFEFFEDENENQKPEWKPMETAGWVGPNDRFIIHIPGKPDDPNQQVQALAAYYQLFPTLFGYKKLIGAGQPEDLGVDQKPFLEFGGVTLRAIALSWLDDDFLNELTHPTLADATPVLSRYLGYTNPWNFRIKFKVHPDFVWLAETPENKIPMWKDAQIPKNIIQLHYPTRPAESKFWPIALTSYNNTGPAYPFSCG